MDELQIKIDDKNYSYCLLNYNEDDYIFISRPHNLKFP